MYIYIIVFVVSVFVSVALSLFLFFRFGDDVDTSEFDQLKERISELSEVDFKLRSRLEEAELSVRWLKS